MARKRPKGRAASTSGSGGGLTVAQGFGVVRFTNENEFPVAIQGSDGGPYWFVLGPGGSVDVQTDAGTRVSLKVRRADRPGREYSRSTTEAAGKGKRTIDGPDRLESGQVHHVSGFVLPRPSEAK